MSTLASVFIALAAALVKVLLQQRQAANDAHAVGRLSGVVSSLEQANAALTFKADAARDPDAVDDLWVRDGAGAVPLPGDDADPRGQAD